MSGILSSSIAKKVSMALSAFFLMFFLLQHFAINILSVFSGNLFNQVSHFMGTNPLIQYVLQPVLIFGVVFHFVMGFILEIKNRNLKVKEKIILFTILLIMFRTGVEISISYWGIDQVIFFSFFMYFYKNFNKKIFL